MEQQKFKYFAFISYSSKDTEWGKKVQRKLEHYRMPATLCNEHGWDRNPIKPVFFAPTDIQPGGLTEELQERLKASRNLIVICSPNSAQSEWVGNEIEFFHQLGRTKQIHFFIVNGIPHSKESDTECFNPIVNTLGLPEILGANIHEKIYRWPWLNKERAYVQLISKLLNVEFDAIWQRHRRLLRQRALGWMVGTILVITALIGVWLTSQPVDVEVKLNEVSVHNNHLPPLKDAIITIILENETKTDTIPSLDRAVFFTNIPHRYINNIVRVIVDCENYIGVDTTLRLKKRLSLNIRRNPEIYGKVEFRLWNPNTERTKANTEIIVDGHQTQSNDSGFVSVFIPLKEQKKTYSIRAASVQLFDSVKTMPCGPNDVIILE